MILDDGTATVYRKVNAASPGEKPVFERRTLTRSRYGVLNYSTDPIRPTDQREETRVDLRIRILQDRRIANHDVVQTENREGLFLYEVNRAYHGRDDDSGELITDLTLEMIEL